MTHITHYQITAPHFCAGLEVDERGRIRRAAPILIWMQRSSFNLDRIRDYCDKKGWKIEKVLG